MFKREKAGPRLLAPPQGHLSLLGCFNKMPHMGNLNAFWRLDFQDQVPADSLSRDSFFPGLRHHLLPCLPMGLSSAPWERGRKGGSSGVSSCKDTGRIRSRPHPVISFNPNYLLRDLSPKTSHPGDQSLNISVCGDTNTLSIIGSQGKDDSLVKAVNWYNLA